MLDWLIVGGGIHGTHVSHVLTALGGVPRDRLRVLDPAERPLARWDAQTRVTGMEYLRSPVVHNLDVSSQVLKRFVAAAQPGSRPYLGRYKRPTLDLFNAHSAEVIRRHKLAALRIQGRAESLRRVSGGWRVDTASGAIDARRVLLAISLSDQPCWPPWARTLAAQGGPVGHVFDTGNHGNRPIVSGRVLVAGGGITGLQTATALARENPGQVSLLLRHDLRETEFDSHPCWLGPRCMSRFTALRDPVRRRQLIANGRNPGSAPADVVHALNQAEVQNGLKVRRGNVTKVHYAGGRVTLTTDSDESLETEHVLLATGFDPKRPGGPWLDAAVDECELPCAPCGYPVVDERLRWAKGLYVTGPLAELELGPVARNISGARRAGTRLVTEALLGDV